MKKNRKSDFFVLAAALILSVSACSGRSITSPDIVMTGDINEITEAEAAVMNEIYTLTPGDLIIANMYLATISILCAAGLLCFANTEQRCNCIKDLLNSRPIIPTVCCTTYNKATCTT